MTIARNIKSRQRGFTLVEFAIVLGIVGVIMSAIWIAQTNAGEKKKETDAVIELQSIVQAMLDNLEGRQAFSAYAVGTWITDKMTLNGLVPNTYADVNNIGYLDSPWNLGVSNATNSGVRIMANGPAIFDVYFGQIPLAGCIALVLNSVNCQYNQAGCPTKIYTHNTGTPGYTKVPAAGSNWENTMTTTEAQTACNTNNYTDGTANVGFEYSLQ